MDIPTLPTKIVARIFGFLCSESTKISQRSPFVICRLVSTGWKNIIKQLDIPIQINRLVSGDEAAKLALLFPKCSNLTVLQLDRAFPLHQLRAFPNLRSLKLSGVETIAGLESLPGTLQSLSLGLLPSQGKSRSIKLGSLSCKLQSLEIFDCPVPPPRSNVNLVTIIVDDYDRAISFFTNVLGFTLVEDTPSKTNDGRTKRWVVVRPNAGGTGMLLAKADGEKQIAAIGNQTAGRVGFFLRTEDFEIVLDRLKSSGTEIHSPLRNESYGRVIVFRDIAGNLWDLLGPPA